MGTDENRNFEYKSPADSVYAPQPLFTLAKRDMAFAVSAVVISIFISIFGLFGGFALGYVISAVLLLLLFAFYFQKNGKIGVFPFVCGLLSLGLNSVFITTTNGSVRFFGVIVGFLLSLVCFDAVLNGKAKGNRKTAEIFYKAVCTPANIAVSLKSLFTSKNGDKQTIGKVLIGLVCAIPVLLVIVPLLISSDDAFRGMMSSITENTIFTLLKAVCGIVISLFIVSYGFSLKNNRTSKIPETTFKGIENAYVISFLSAIAVCYLLYLFSQLAYFFSAFSGFLPNGEITYAGYARKGFFEMCVIAVINLIIVFFSLLLSRKQNDNSCVGIKVITTFISVFTLMIIATAISKMVLYIGTYGMTVLRLTTSAFMVFLSVVFISVILRIYFTKINVIKTALLAAGCIIFLLGTVNVNAVCAKYNYHSYINGKLDTIDVDALYNLGDEGIPYIIALTEDTDFDTAQNAKQYLVEAYWFDYFDNMQGEHDLTVSVLKRNEKHTGFSYFSVPRAKAYDALYEFIQDNPAFCGNCQIDFEDTNYELF